MKKLGELSEKYAWKRLQAGFLYGARLRKNLSIRQAAKRCGIHWTTFEKAENGFPVSNTVARKIADGMELTEEQALRLVMGYLPPKEETSE